MDGVAQLIRLCGSERHQKSLGHQIFLHYRTSAVSLRFPLRCSEH